MLHCVNVIRYAADDARCIDVKMFRGVRILLNWVPIFKKNDGARFDPKIFLTISF